MTSKLRLAWQRMKYRCISPSGRNPKNYKEKGIVVCSEWSDDFNAFRTWAISSGYRPGLWIDRINNEENYEPSNCRWVTPAESARNTSAVRLRPRDVIAIRLLSMRGLDSASIAKKYKITEKHARLVIRGKRWRGVQVTNNSKNLLTGFPVRVS